MVSNEGRDINSFNKAYAQGLQDERKVKAFLCALGFRVTNANKEENLYQDIDCWVGDISVSIKAEHAALKYVNRCFYFETRQKQTETQLWEDSWFYTGKAMKYLILQGTTLYLIDKVALYDYIEQHGFDYKKTLGWKTRQRSGGTYRYDDAECGYVSVKKVPIEKVWELTEAEAAA